MKNENLTPENLNKTKEEDQIELEVLKRMNEKELEKKKERKEWVVNKINEGKKSFIKTLKTISTLLLMYPTILYISSIFLLKNDLQIITNLIIFLIITPFWLRMIKRVIFSNKFFEKRINTKEEDLSDKDIEDFLTSRMMDKIGNRRCCDHDCNPNYDYNNEEEGYEEEPEPEPEFENYSNFI